MAQESGSTTMLHCDTSKSTTLSTNGMHCQEPALMTSANPNQLQKAHPPRYWYTQILEFKHLKLRDSFKGQKSAHFSHLQYHCSHSTSNWSTDHFKGAQTKIHKPVTYCKSTKNILYLFLSNTHDLFSNKSSTKKQTCDSAIHNNNQQKRIISVLHVQSMCTGPFQPWLQWHQERLTESIYTKC